MLTTNANEIKICDCYRVIIDKESPGFEKKLPREVGRLGTKLMKSLNIQQQRAVLRALAAKDYALLQGLPGTGTYVYYTNCRILRPQLTVF